MAYKIDTAQCTGCGACEIECPNKAIVERKSLFSIVADKCTECIGFFDKPQCVAVCPVDDTILVDTTHPRYLATAGGASCV
jgi:ferredoxin